MPGAFNVYVETNWLVSCVLVHHELRRDARSLLEAAERGECSLRIPKVALLEARHVVERETEEHVKAVSMVASSLAAVARNLDRLELRELSVKVREAEASYRIANPRQELEELIVKCARFGFQHPEEEQLALAAPACARRPPKSRANGAAFVELGSISGARSTTSSAAPASATVAAEHHQPPSTTLDDARRVTVVLDDHTLRMTIIIAVVAAQPDPALRKKILADVDETLTYTPRGEVPGKVTCALCGAPARHGWLVNATAVTGAPGFSAVLGEDQAREPMLCEKCLEMDWHGRARHLALAEGALGRLDGPDSAPAREALLRAVANQPVHSEASGRCTFCSRRGRAIRGRRASACDGCVALAVEALHLAITAFVAAIDAQKAAELRAKQAIRIPAEMREAAHARAADAASLRLPAEEAAAPGDARWDALTEGLAAKDPYEAVQAWRARARQETPPGSAVDALALRLADVLEEVALAGLQRLEKTRASGEMDVLVSDWPARAVDDLLSQHHPGPAARLRLDESIFLIDEVIATGVGYQGYNGSTDFDCIDVLNEVYLALQRFP